MSSESESSSRAPVEPPPSSLADGLDTANHCFIFSTRRGRAVLGQVTHLDLIIHPNGGLRTCQTVKESSERTFTLLQDQQDGRASKRQRVKAITEHLGHEMPWTIPMGWSGGSVPAQTAKTPSNDHASYQRPSLAERASIPHEPNIDLHVPDIEPVAEPGSRVSRSGRKIRATWKVRDQLPEPESMLEENAALENIREADSADPGLRREGPARRVVLLVTERIRGMFNTFGLRRFYKRRPHRPPPVNLDINARYTPTANNVAQNKSARPLKDILDPFPNLSSFLFARHHMSSSSKSLEDRASLQALLTRPDFDTRDLVGVQFDKIDDKLAQEDNSLGDSALDPKDGWRESSITIGIPSGRKATAASRREEATTQRRLQRHQHVTDTPASEPIAGHHYTVHGFWHKSLCMEIRHTLSLDPSAKDFVFDPYVTERRVPGSAERVERVHGELYTSDAFVQEDLRLQNAPPEPGCELPRAIAALMFWSDATQVAQFGQAKVWPNYLYYGNQSKYERARPTAHAAHHVAYFPSLPDDVHDFIRHHTGKTPSPQLLAHCRRELFHGAWNCLLDEEFLHACEHGMIVDCMDGVRRRIYPRVFTYSADYPEKVLIATIRDKGRCPCPRCLVTFEDVPNVGEEEDDDARISQRRCPTDARHQAVETARGLIYSDGYVVNSDRVESILQPESLVPTENVFGKLKSLDYHQMLVVDLLHEYELGVWKSLFAHLIRILDSIDGQCVDRLNERFRQVPSFGRGTIRRFAHNVSEMKRMAARDFEDILQCIIPCIEGLVVTEHNQHILSLLYHTAYWHALAKMRMHTDASLDLLSHSTTVLGRSLRYFAEVTCMAFDTKESKAEYAARQRALARRKSVNSANSTALVGRRPRTFNLKIIKVHFLGDYVRCIKHFGTTDSYTTQIGEHEHRHIKACRKRTNFVRPDAQVVAMDVRAARMRRIGYALEERGIVDPGGDSAASTSALPDPASEDAGPLAARDHHSIAKEQRNAITLRQWQYENTGDVSITDFSRHLRAHLFARLRADRPSLVLIDSDHVVISQGCIYPHATLQVNFTTYDLQRDQDVIHVGTDKTAVMVLSCPPGSIEGATTPPWTYARILGIYHCNVTVRADNKVVSERLDFLWVRWLENADSPSCFGVHTSSLERLQYVPFCDTAWSDTFGFIDPATVIRGCHLIPAFHYGQSTSLLPPCVVRPHTGDWAYYYLNRFADRDMFVRHLGHSVGSLELQHPVPEHIVPSDYIYDIPTFDETSSDEVLDDPLIGNAEPEVDLEEHVNDEDLALEDIDELRSEPSTRHRESLHNSTSSLTPYVVDFPLRALSPKGAMLGIVGDLFRDFAQIISAGVSANPDTPLTALKCRHVPFVTLHDICVLMYSNGTVRGTDLNNVKIAIAGWRTFSPPIHLDGGAGKDLRGFNHDECGKLLCPAKWDWTKPEVCDGLRNNSSKYPLNPANLPNFLWEDEYVLDQSQMFKGFGRGPLLVLALRHSLLGPKAATAPSSLKIAARKPKAQIHRIRSITTGAIAYAAVLPVAPTKVHFGLSAQEAFNATGHGNKFNYEMFYQAVIQALEEYLLDRERMALLAWWNGQIFNAQYNLEADLEDNDAEEDGEPSVLALMREQARARREQEDLASGAEHSESAATNETDTRPPTASE
ncbi:hypothetical protein BN946_scf184652.g23 [Trametes cinnabarina]|uniref:Uncharacterized protein n=1 Tax=Pycnoporus cinnabarinus TaxID=5643 RepID=A0A060S3C8_PYCCI|nr:hypothetical protein BN946_scf184652.g23 [Trametes cinnabarina]